MFIYILCSFNDKLFRNFSESGYFFVISWMAIRLRCFLRRQTIRKPNVHSAGCYIYGITIINLNTKAGNTLPSLSFLRCSSLSLLRYNSALLPPEPDLCHHDFSSRYTLDRCPDLFTAGSSYRFGYLRQTA